MILEEARCGLQRACERRCDNQVDCHVTQDFPRALNLLLTQLAQGGIVVERIDPAA
jgi:hypothetical protein